MNGNESLLEDVYKNAQMGAETISHLLEITEDEELLSQMEAQYSEFRSLKKEAAGLIRQNGRRAKGLTTNEKIKTELAVKAQTLRDRSTSHIAEMLILGNMMGVIDSERSINKSRASGHCIGLAVRLRNIEENNIVNLKKFL